VSYLKKKTGHAEAHSARVGLKKLDARLILFHAYESIAPVVMGTPMIRMASPASGAIVDKL
jgi:hypothetical protein